MRIRRICNLHTLLVAMRNSTATLKDSLTVTQKLFKFRVTAWPSNSIPRYIHKRIESRSTKNLLTNIHSSIIQNRVKNNQISVNKWINNVPYPRNEILFSHKKECSLYMTHATTWVNLESTIPSKKSQIQKATYYMNPEERKFVQTESTLVVNRS